MSNEAPLVRLIEVSRVYGAAAVPVTALAGVSLQVRRGERLALLGKSGSGKSTVLNILGGLDRPTAGVAEVAGRDLARLSSKALADHRLRTVGIVFQSFNLISARTALENVELPLLFAGRAAVERRARAVEALEAVGLAERMHHRPTELSGGEAQRVAIARAVINEPDLVLADEPTGNLDSTTAAVVMDLLLGQVKARGATLILVTHDEELARRCADRIVWLRDGRLES
jgi:predicted ABC-type transport system involved in lysophospholipase L1 biosynthesis ATPase subunit